MLVRDQVNACWSMGFVSDQLANGRRFRVLNVVDDFSRECVLQVVDFSISGQRLARELDRLAERRQLPKAIVCDNGLKARDFVAIWTRGTAARPGARNSLIHARRGGLPQ